MKILHPINKNIIGVVLALLGASQFGRMLAADIPEISGSGNFTTGEASTLEQSRFSALNSSGGEAIRINAYPYSYYDGQRPLPEKMDSQVLAAYRSGVKTIVILFEFYGKFRQHPDAPNQLGDYAKWHSIGQDYAERFSPNSAWLKSQGIADWGVTIFEAFNEPDGESPKDALPKTGPSSYFTSLKGLADGVHAVSPSLAVIPGGFMSENAFSDHTLKGYGLALAPLWNDGTLDGIDLHTYNDIKYAPIVRMDGSVTFEFSPQDDFDSVKKACHITRDINFYTTEYNFKANEQGIDASLAAKRYLTCIWANLCVVKNDGTTPATRLALTWNLFSEAQKDKTYGMALQSQPWQPDSRAEVFQRVMALTKGMHFVQLNSDVRGEFILQDDGRKLWVWQNYDKWTKVPGTTFTISGIPSTATKLDVMGWDGIRQSLPLHGEGSYQVTGLSANETYMFLATSAVSSK